MDLKELLGTAYKDGMTLEDINSVLANKKFADLDSGKYVNKDMADKKASDLNNQIASLQEQLNNKLTDDEKKEQANAEKDKLIKQLQQQVKDSILATNRNQIYSKTSGIRTKIGLADDDKDFNSFASSITFEDTKVNDSVSTYMNKILEEAYNKGVADTTKGQIANNNNIKSDTQVQQDKTENIGTRLGKIEAEGQKNTATEKFFLS